MFSPKQLAFLKSWQKFPYCDKFFIQQWKLNVCLVGALYRFGNYLPLTTSTPMIKLTCWVDCQHSKGRCWKWILECNVIYTLGFSQFGKEYSFTCSLNKQVMITYCVLFSLIVAYLLARLDSYHLEEIYTAYSKTLGFLQG